MIKKTRLVLMTSMVLSGCGATMSNADLPYFDDTLDIKCHGSKIKVCQVEGASRIKRNQSYLFCSCQK